MSILNQSVHANYTSEVVFIHDVDKANKHAPPGYQHARPPDRILQEHAEHLAECVRLAMEWRDAMMRESCKIAIAWQEHHEEHGWPDRLEYRRAVVRQANAARRVLGKDVL